MTGRFSRTLTGIVCLIFIYFGSAQAQIHWGAHAGVNFSSLDFSDNVALIDGRTGTIAGVTMEYQFGWASIYFSPQYAMKGADMRLEDGYFTEFTTQMQAKKISQEYSYLEIPFGVRVLLIEEGIRPYLFGGLAMAFLLSAKSIPQDAHGTDVGAWHEDIREYLNDTDALFHIGGGVAYEVAEGVAVTADIRYSRSLQSLWKEDIGSTLKTDDIMLIFGVLW